MHVHRPSRPQLVGLVAATAATLLMSSTLALASAVASAAASASPGRATRPAPASLVGAAVPGARSSYLGLSADETQAAQPLSGPPLVLFAYLADMAQARAQAVARFEAGLAAARAGAARQSVWHGGGSTGAAPSVGAGGDRWAAVRQCESGGNYSTNTGNGYYGAYQFSASTWHSLGYGGLPSDAAPAVQDQAAQQLQARSGWGQWPVCGSR